MKHGIVVVIGMLAAAVAAAADEAVKVELAAPIQLNQTDQAIGGMTSLTSEARELGLGQARLSGDVADENLADQSTRVRIEWSVLSTKNGESAIEPPLTSRLRVRDQASIDSRTEMTAQGQLNAVVEAFDRAQGGAAIASGQSGTGTGGQALDARDVATAPSSGGTVPVGGSGTGSTGTSGGAGGDGLNTSVASTRVEACDPRVDQAAGKVFKQVRIVKEDQDGNVLDTSDCKDEGSGVAIQRETSSCDPLVNLAQSTVNPRYREFAILDGERIEVAGCAADTTVAYQINPTSEGCQIRDDMTGGYSIQQQRLYYEGSEGREYVTECQDADNPDLTYAHFVSRGGCEDVIDSDSGTVILMGRTAYELSGQIEYVSDCRPLQDQSVAIQTEICADRYDHDYATGTSYLRDRTYYIDNDGQKAIISDCSRNTSVSYDHSFVAGDCGYDHDNSKLQSDVLANRVFEGYEGEIVTLENCEVKDTVPYAFSGYATSSSSYNNQCDWACRLKEVYANANWGGLPERWIEGSKASSNDLDMLANNWAPGPTGWRCGFNGQIEKEVRKRVYIRADGSKYKPTDWVHHHASVDCEAFSGR